MPYGEQRACTRSTRLITSRLCEGVPRLMGEAILKHATLARCRKRSCAAWVTSPCRLWRRSARIASIAAPAPLTRFVSAWPCGVHPGHFAPAKTPGAHLSRKNDEKRCGNAVRFRRSLTKLRSAAQERLRRYLRQGRPDERARCRSCRALDRHERRSKRSAICLFPARRTRPRVLARRSPGG
jgi:hypothetical protein